MSRRIWTGALAAVVTLAALAPSALRAESQDDWQFSATIYGWLPSIDINTRYPSDGGSSINVSESDILNALEFTFMGAMSAMKGHWGIGTDVIYLDLSSTDKQTRQLTVGGVPLPADVTAKATIGLTGWLWTTAGYYRAVDLPDYKLDLLAGARMLDLDTTLKWSLTGDLGDPPYLSAKGHSDVSKTFWDGIVGIRGRALLGEDKKWFIPYYVDVGAGDSDLTWQGIIGAGYAFGWGDVELVWRYLDYNLPSSSAIESSNFSGAAIGATFHF